MKNILFIFLVLASLSVGAQRNILFQEDFEGYVNDWELVNDEEFVVKQDSGKLYISKANQNSVKNGCLWYKKTISKFDTSKDLSIKFDANAISSESENGGFDIQWGKIYEADGVRIKSLHQLDFGVNKVRLSKFEMNNGGWTYYNWSDTLYDPSLDKFKAERNTSHKYEIIQKGKVLTVVIDGKLVYKIPIEPKTGSEIGFQRCLKGELLLDNLVIMQ
ncbi:MAG: hypothetical protein EOO43_26855 [Flavobacterium sp.]|nr:MAG: hypothetical protein EOO43_26855 [Flavobacterium sp.]